MTFKVLETNTLINFQNPYEPGYTYKSLKWRHTQNEMFNIRNYSGPKSGDFFHICEVTNNGGPRHDQWPGNNDWGAWRMCRDEWVLIKKTQKIVPEYGQGAVVQKTNQNCTIIRLYLR